MHVFTSITANYLPKARVLAASLKRFHPEAVFHLVLADRLPEDYRPASEPFDNVILAEGLPIPNFRAWAFKHSVVEMCTAVKGPAACVILDEYGADHLYYFDPDIAVLGPLDGLEEQLQSHSILLTPHLTAPEEDLPAILDNEVCALQHGIFNLGFLAVSADDEARRFLLWWCSRLLQLCYDDIPSGLFTDQRWVDLAPGFFPRIGIVREPQYNVATWNLSHRVATGRAPYEIAIEGKPLAFFHFSGFDSGAQEVMLKRYGAKSPVLFDLRDWYVAECERWGQSRDGQRPCVFSYFDDGTAVRREHRLLYRARLDLQRAFPDPFNTTDAQSSFLHWYRANATPVNGPGIAVDKVA